MQNPYENPKPEQAAAKRRLDAMRGPAPEYDGGEPEKADSKLWPKPTPEHPYDFAHPIED